MAPFLTFPPLPLSRPLVLDSVWHPCRETPRPQSVRAGRPVCGLTCGHRDMNDDGDEVRSSVLDTLIFPLMPLDGCTRAEVFISFFLLWTAQSLWNYSCIHPSGSWVMGMQRLSGHLQGCDHEGAAWTSGMLRSRSLPLMAGEEEEWLLPSVTDAAHVCPLPSSRRMAGKPQGEGGIAYSVG